ncbi:hypothetical protein LXJ15735_06860 [Lacrimispora xylanolytica]
MVPTVGPRADLVPRAYHMAVPMDFHILVSFLVAVPMDPRGFSVPAAAPMGPMGGLAPDSAPRAGPRVDSVPRRSCFALKAVQVLPLPLPILQSLR